MAVTRRELFARAFAAVEEIADRADVFVFANSFESDLLVETMVSTNPFMVTPICSMESVMIWTAFLFAARFDLMVAGGNELKAELLATLVAVSGINEFVFTGAFTFFLVTFLEPVIGSFAFIILSSAAVYAASPSRWRMVVRPEAW